MAAALLSSPLPSALPNSRSGFDVLCACAAVNPAPEHAARIANWNCARFDWSEFLAAAEHHGVLAPVARNLAAYGRGIPSDVAQSLKAAYAANLRRGLWFAAELMRIVQHFAHGRVRVLPYKGPVLAQAVYGDLGLRSFSDLDLLISPDDFGRAKAALAEIGYQPSQKVAPAVERLWLRTGYERSFDGAAGKNLVELQWNLLPYFYAVDFRSADFRFDDLMARSGRIVLGAAEEPVELGAGIPCLSPEDSLLVLCLHAAKHLWTRLIWVADIAESLRVPGLDCALVVARARALGISRILGVSVWLAEHLLGAAIPSSVRESLALDPEVQLLGDECAARLRDAATYDFESAEYFRRIFKLRERRSDRWRYLWRLAATPGPGDVAAITLPEAMFPLYRAVRAGRLVHRGISTMFRRRTDGGTH
jgi:hypothetical protein